MSIWPRRAHAHRKPGARGGIDQAVEAEDVLPARQPAHLGGRQTEPLRRVGVVELKVFDPVEYSFAQLGAQRGARRFCSHANVLP